MRDFGFYNPVRIDFGKGKEEHIGQYMKEVGAKKFSCYTAASACERAV